MQSHLISKGEAVKLKVAFSLENKEVRRQCDQIVQGLKKRTAEIEFLT